MSHICETCATPFGTVELLIVEANGQRVALLKDESEPRAALYAAKDHDITRVIEVVAAQPNDRLLVDPAVLVPHDTIDLTVGRSATFFTDKGYGFLSQQQVFCPELRAAAIAALADAPAHSFTRGTLAVMDDSAQPYDPRWSASMRAQSGVPAAYLAKELELCYTVLGIVGKIDNVESLMSRITAHLPLDRACSCGTTMQTIRERGLIGDDWRTWISIPTHE